MDMVPETLSSKTQKITHDNEPESCTEIFAREVIIQCRNNVHNHGSSKVKLINRIDYNWELRYYIGQLVAIHTEKNIVAYAMKGKDAGMVRIFNQETGHRTLIKNMKNDVRDVSFAFTKNEVILSCVDDEGNILIYEIIDKPTEILYNLIFHIYHGDYEGSTPPSNFRLYWCPYIPSSEDDVESTEDASKCFAFLNGRSVEVWDISMTTSKYGPGPRMIGNSGDSAVEIKHSAEVVDAAYSSDGTAVATASVNGYVGFYQIYICPGPPEKKLLHEWRPHDGKQLSCLLFIDNIIEYSPETRFWKFAITGANHNQEIKIWSCENWNCIQTIHFQPSPSCVIPSVFLKIRMDYRGKYVIMSDINNRVLYVLKLLRNNTDKLVYLSWVAEFLLPAPFLSYHIVDAGERKMSEIDYQDDEDFNPDDFDDEDQEESADYTSIKMLVIQPKKFQECDVIFSPARMMTDSKEVVAETSDTELTLVETSAKLKELELENSVTLLLQQKEQQPQLMTPEDFSNPGHHNSSEGARKSISHEGSVCGKSSTGDVVKDDDNLIDIGLERPLKDNFASGGSSPSREVEEIFQKSNYSSQEFFEKITKPEEAEEPQKPYSESIFQGGAGNSVAWPKIPMIEDNEIVKDDSNHKYTNGDTVSDNNDLSIINYRLTSLESAVRKQTLYIEQIMSDIKSIANQQKDTSNDNDMEDFSKELELAFSKQHLQIAKLLENLLNIQKTNECNKQEEFIVNVSQVLGKTVLDHLQPIIVQELKNTLGPPIRNMVDGVKHQIDVQYSHKLQSTDQLLKDNIAKMINNKAVTDSVSLSVVSILAPTLERSYKEMISSSLVPAIEKVANNMFQQLNSTFSQGTKEYLSSVENYMEKQRKIQEQGKELAVQMSSVSDSVKTNLEKLSSSLSKDLNKQFNTAFRNMQDKLLSSVKEVVTEQVQQGFKSQAVVIEDSVMNAVRSRAVTPSPHMADTQSQMAQIQTSLSKGHYNEAFQLALTAENLSFVIYVCEKVDVQTFFADEVPLNQSCLLALIQQLSVDLVNYTDLKLSYIRSALLSLSPDHPTTRQFMSKILKELLKQLKGFTASNPPMKHLTEARLLTMAAESMLSSQMIK